MKRFLVVLFVGIIVSLMGTTEAKAQNVNDNIYEKESIPGKRVVPYRALREADVIWKKTIWQLIDCREKMNHLLYYPLADMDDRKSLVSTLIYGIDNEGLTAYGDDEFKEMLTRDEVYELFDAGEQTQQVRNPETGELETRVVPGEIKYEEIEQYEIKEIWYFDKQHSTMRVRILGICPIRRYMDPETAQFRKERTFWIYFPEARPIFAQQEVYNRHNDAHRISFDDLFWQRRFSSFVVRESNVYDNRPIAAYMQGVNNLMEAERVKQELFEFEHDLWEY